MIILSVLVSCLIFFVVSRGFFEDYSGMQATCECFIIATIAIIAIMTVSLVIEHLTVSGTKNRIEAVRTAINDARQNGGEEQAGLIQEKIKWNNKIIGYKTYNGTVWDIWNPEELAEIELIK